MSYQKTKDWLNSYLLFQTYDIYIIIVRLIYFLLSIYISYNKSTNQNKSRFISCLNYMNKIYLKVRKNTLNLKLIISKDFYLCNIL